MIWRTEQFNHAGVIVSNIENIIWLFFCLLEAAFKIHLAQKSEGARAPRFEWAWHTLWKSLQSMS